MLKKVQFLLMSKVLPPFFYLVLLLLRSTYRISHVNESPLDSQVHRAGFIVCFWHSRLLLMPFARKWGTAKVLISRHRDGEFIARIIHFFKGGTIRGSYKKISVSSLREIIDDLRNGIDIAITPDGPKGPRYTIKNGVLDIARLTGRPIVPVTYGAGKKKLFSPGTNLFYPALSAELSFCGGILSTSTVT